MARRIKIIYKIFVAKWIHGVCHSCCLTCEYKHECISEFIALED